MYRLTVMDVFCGAGGFSEGFRQQDYEIILGIDSWEPAIKTFNHNFGLNCNVRNVLDFEDSVEEIEALPDTDIIIGSPPCVTFSSSNKSGKADKSLGVRLTETFLRIVAVKKYMPNSKLKAWLMENVSNSVNFLNEKYTFKDLNLSKWALQHNLFPEAIAITLKENQPIINSADYGSPQVRKRVISGEFVAEGSLIVPHPTHQLPDKKGNQPTYLTLGKIKKSLPRVNSPEMNQLVVDPLYPKIKVKASELSDHYYDTGLYQCEWRQSKFLKVNHPFMGKMSFPENEDKPSRTIMATKIGASREAIIYRSEFGRKGNGEFRTPTVRESACIMGFPITYQFIGSEGVKCKLVGNAVCPSVSRAFAKQIRKDLALPEIVEPIVCLTSNLKGINDLNTYSPKEFGNPPKRNKGSRFRRHPFKDGNITVTLSNYNINQNEKEVGRWLTSVQYGTGAGFPSFDFSDGFFQELEPLIRETNKGKEFLKIINNGFSEKIGKKVALQEMYEIQRSQNGFLEPTELIEEVSMIIERLDLNDKEFSQNGTVIFDKKQIVPLKQLYALYAINRISSIANN